MNVADEMSLGSLILTDLYFIDPSAVIAGGAPRDWYFDKTCSDIDVYFYYRPDLSSVFISDILSKIFNADMRALGNTELQAKQEHRYLRDEHISNVWEFEYFGKTVQLIRRNIPTFGITNTFALNLSMIWFKNGMINPEKPFLDGVKNKSIIKMNELYCDGDRYIEKTKSKFPNYKYFSDEISFYKYYSNKYFEER